MNLLDLIFPRRCVSCGKLGRYFCKSCQKTIETSQSICPICEIPAIDGETHPKCQTRYTLDGLTSFFRYKGIIRQGVRSIKYRFVSHLAEEFINLIPDSSLQFITHNLFTRRSRGCGGQPTTLIPIPLHPTRERFRGFNQTEILGKFLAKRLGIPIRGDILRRVGKTIPQVEMKDRKKRLKNMEGVFAVNHLTIQQFDQMTILLFDDVFTTGATFRSAATVLKRKGAKTVWALALAHG